MRRVIARECFDSIQITKHAMDQALSELDVQELQEYIIKNKLDMTNFIWSPKELRIINYVGLIQLSAVTIEILPKVSITSEERSREVLLMLLSYSGYLDVDYSELSSLKDTRHSLLEIFGYLFAMRLKAEIRKGLQYSYIAAEDHLSFIKGKVVVTGHISNVIRGNGKAYCRYDEFSADNELNQVFKFVTRFLISRIHSLQTMEVLKYCLMQLDQVSDTLPSIDSMERIHFNRTNQRFYPAFLLARMFLGKYCSLMAAGKQKCFSILFEMNDLFESYISKVAVRSLAAKVHLQHNQYKLLVNEKNGRGAYMLRPDIVITNDAGEQLIIDTKWKMISDSFFRYGVSREDYFQMYAYLTRYQACRSVILLYPHHAEIGVESGSRLESYYLENDTGKFLRVYSVDWENIDKTISDVRKIVCENIDG